MLKLRHNPLLSNTSTLFKIPSRSHISPELYSREAFNFSNSSSAFSTPKQNPENSLDSTYFMQLPQEEYYFTIPDDRSTHIPTIEMSCSNISSDLPLSILSTSLLPFDINTTSAQTNIPQKLFTTLPIANDDDINNAQVTPLLYLDSTLRKRRRKMNKHKHQKMKKKHRFLLKKHGK